jgi:hypothetical protein
MSDVRQVREGWFQVEKVGFSRYFLGEENKAHFHMPL